jgi:hypothetical protein
VSREGRISTVRKRDGRAVPYDRSKIVSAVARAEAAAGEPRAGFAEEVAGLVELLLERRFADPAIAQPGIEDVQDLVERALVEMGAAPVAKAYILYRERRANARAALQVRGEPAGAARRPRVEAQDGAPEWSKGRIVAALMGEADLPRASAEEVASRVEARVFASGLRSITPALVRELVDNELLELGFEDALRRHRPIGIPRHDLRNLLRRRGAEAGAIESAVSGEILARYCAEDLLPRAVADLVRAGDVDFEDLRRPHLPLSLAIPSEALPSGAAAGGKPGPESAAALLPEIGRLCAQASRTVAIEGLEPFLAALERSSPAGLRAFLAGLAGIAAASGRGIEVLLSKPRAIGASLSALAELEREHAPDALPRLVVDLEALADLDGEPAEAAERLLQRGLLAASWGTSAERPAGGGLSRREGERGAIACAAALALDLPRLARKAGAWREDALFEAAAARIELGVPGLLALRDLQRELRDPAAPRARAVFGLEPVGLVEALAILGDGEVREEQAGRLVAFLAEAAERIGRAHGIALRPTTVFGERAAARFARLDALEFRVRQPWLFAESPGIDGDAVRPYAADLASVSEPALVALLGSLTAGTLRPSPALPALALPALVRLARRRGRARGGAHALYALPPLPVVAPQGAPEPDLFVSAVPQPR